MPTSLSGQLLIASPSMADFFRRSVVLVVEHNDEGAFGLVLNRPSETTVGEAVPELAELIGPEHVLHVGGPVQPGAVTAVGEHADPGDSTQARSWERWGWSTSTSPPKGRPELSRVRVFAGYAGWGPGQLDDELEADAWIVEDAHPDDPFSEGDLWAEVLSRKGGEFVLLARMPADPSVN